MSLTGSQSRTPPVIARASGTVWLWWPHSGLNGWWLSCYLRRPPQCWYQQVISAGESWLQCAGLLINTSYTFLIMHWCSVFLSGWRLQLLSSAAWHRRWMWLLFLLTNTWRCDASTLFIHIVKTAAPLQFINVEKKTVCSPGKVRGARTCRTPRLRPWSSYFSKVLLCRALSFKAPRSSTSKPKSAETTSVYPKHAEIRLISDSIIWRKGKIWQQAEHYFLKANFIMFFHQRQCPRESTYSTEWNAHVRFLCCESRGGTKTDVKNRLSLTGILCPDCKG